MTRMFTAVLGNATDSRYEHQLHELRHRDRVEYVSIGTSDLARRRLRLTTDKGTECAIALPRSTILEHGSILEISETGAIVVELETLPWLSLSAADRVSALQLGFLAGHHHWRVRMEDETLLVAMEQPRESYLARIEHLLASGAVTVLDE